MDLIKTLIALGFLLFLLFFLAGCDKDKNTSISGLPVSYQIHLSWVAPSARSDGNVLGLSEIASYTIYINQGDGLKSVSVAPHLMSTTLSVPTEHIADVYMVTIDVLGQSSVNSNHVMKVPTEI